MNKRQQIQDIEDQLTDAMQQARTLVADLSEEAGTWRPKAQAWSVAECLDHLAVMNRVYVQAMKASASITQQEGKHLGGSATPGLFGRWLVRTMEPPVKKLRSKTPTITRPRTSPSLDDAFSSLMESQSEVHAFLLENADLDLAGVRFDNPFIKGLRFSLATGLNLIAAHERRHLWQAWQVRDGYYSRPGIL